MATEKMATSYCDWLQANTANAPKAMAAVPETSPSSPSVKLTAFEKPTSQKTINNT